MSRCASPPHYYNFEMGYFDVLADDNDSTDEEISKDADELITVTEQTQLAALQSADELETDGMDGWHVIGARETHREAEIASLSDSEETCFVCHRHFNRRFPGTVIPCSVRCNQEIQIHKRCLRKWQEKSGSCPLCRSPLVIPDVSSGDSSIGVVGNQTDGEDEATSFVFVEVDAKARRASAYRRGAKANTFKAAQQRGYAMAKRDAQRAQAKTVTFSSEYDEEYD